MIKRFMTFNSIMNSIELFPTNTIIKSQLEDFTLRLVDCTVINISSRVWVDENRNIIQTIDGSKVFEVINFEFEGDVKNEQ